MTSAQSRAPHQEGPTFNLVQSDVQRGIFWGSKQILGTNAYALALGYPKSLLGLFTPAPE